MAFRATVFSLMDMASILQHIASCSIVQYNSIHGWAMQILVLNISSHVAPSVWHHSAFIKEQQLIGLGRHV